MTPRHPTIDPKTAAAQVIANGRPLMADDAERGLLGALLADGSLVPAAREILPDPEDFASSLHAAVYDALLRAEAEGRPVDPPALTGVLRASGVLSGDAANMLYDLSDLDAWPTTAGVEARAQAIAAMATRRRCVDFGARTIVEAQDWTGTADELVQQVEAKALKVGRERATGVGGLTTAGDIVDGYLRDLRSDDPEPAGRQVLTGWPSVDAVLSMRQGNLIIFGAASSMGKSVMVRNVLAHAAVEQGIPSALLSMEMNRHEIGELLIAQQAGVSLNQLKAAKEQELAHAEWDRIDYAAGLLRENPIHIDDTASQTIDTVRARCRRLVKDHGVGIIGIDYLQLIRGEQNRNGSRQDEVAGISRSLKALAGDLGIVIIALSQINRESIKRPDKRPRMSDLRESGAIEQDANAIVLLHREDYYHRTEMDYAPNNVSEFIVAKQRVGETGTVRLNFNGPCQRFEEFSQQSAVRDDGLYGG